MEYKHIEQKLSEIGAKIANATDLSRQAKELASNSEFTLMNAQKEIDTLYISLEDDDPPQHLKMGELLCISERYSSLSFEF